MQIEGDLLFVTWVGDILPEDVEELHACLQGMLDEHDFVFLLIDATRGQSIGPEARRRGGSWPLAHRAGGVALFGASLTLRAMVTIVFALLKIFVPGSAVPVEFAKTKAGARAWLDARRLELSSRGKRTPRT
jgi:hypothetical protein